ncbi:MAG: ATP-binding cassette domain-containing protein [bacterium]
MIGPSGCGKSTLLRSVNRINERLGYVRTEGGVRVLGHDVYAPENALVQVRKQVGMVFQRPNVLPLSIRDNILFGHRLHDGRKDVEDELVERAQAGAPLGRREGSAEPPRPGALPGAAAELCIARLLPVKPHPPHGRALLRPSIKGTEAVEELIWELRGEYTILLVTHNMAQARRASEECVFMLMGKLIEHTATDQMFVSPRHQETADYIEGATADPGRPDMEGSLAQPWDAGHRPGPGPAAR